ncbi:MAG TPA: tetratricopeptide repeat protein [Candidatus Dormibacteraeota bacterium]|nr:tetratricopeptide repeat protein [Candidatus Dormibacteraeota bacterium]
MPHAAHDRASRGLGSVTGLPVRLTSFLGREVELAQLDGLVRASRLVTVTGTAGLGKTRLAIEVASRLPGDSALSIWFTSLADLTDGGLVPQQIATGLGVRERSGETLVQTLAAHIGSQPMLLLIDNCEHVLDASSTLVDALLRSCADLHVLATSRRPLRVPSEVVWRIAPLSLPDRQHAGALQTIVDSEAVRLFEARASLVRSRFKVGPGNAQTVALICRRLDGIPLAIELAAARTEMMSVEDILSRLDDRFSLLEDSGPVAVPRHRTLQAALDWDHQLLNEQERRLFRRISVFRGGFESEAAEAICAGEGVEADEVMQLVFRLVEKSLLVTDVSHPGPTRYQLLDTVRVYGADRLAESGELPGIARRHALHYLALALRAERFERSPELTHWLQRLEADHDNLRAALGWCRANDRRSCLQLAASLTWFWVTHGYFTEGREWLEAALEGTAGDASGQAHGLLSIARLSFWQGDYVSAREHCSRSLTLYRQLGDDGGAGWALTQLGSIYAYEGDVDLGRQHLEAVLASVDDGHLRMEALVALGEMLLQTGDVAEARAQLEEVRALVRGPEAPRGRAALFLGLVDFFNADYQSARRNVAEAMDIFRLLGNRYAVAAALDVCAGLAMVESEPIRALCLSGAAAGLRESIRARLAPRWQEVLSAVVIEPASQAAGDLALSAWGEGMQMTFDEATRYAMAALPAAPVPALPDVQAQSRSVAGLSRREIEVANLVVQGMTNRQIAAHLKIAERTAEGHVERIRRKLKVRSRTRIAVAILRERAWPR